MIVVVKNNPDKKKLNSLIATIESKGPRVEIIQAAHNVLLAVIGDTWAVGVDNILAQSIVDDVIKVQAPYHLAARDFKPDDTVIKIGGVEIGGGNFQFIAGPCSVESEKQICSIAASVKNSGASILRGGAFRPRSSPYGFEGLRELGIELLLEAKRRTGMPIVTEVMDIAHLPFFEDVDIIQVGAKNMQNYELLRELGTSGKPILLKRGVSCTLEDMLMSTEHIMAAGNNQVILCERGIRTFETQTRDTLDISAVPSLKMLTHLPVIVDPSHVVRDERLVMPLSLAAVASGADGLMIEVHNDPEGALHDGSVAITPDKFDRIVESAQYIMPHSWKRDQQTSH